MVRLNITCFEDYNCEWRVESTLLQLDIPSKLETTKVSLRLLLDLDLQSQHNTLGTNSVVWLASNLQF